MTEAEWMECTAPAPMLDFALEKAGDRKPRLFAVTCCRRIQPFLPDQNAIERRLEIAERYADGLATLQELKTAQVFLVCGGGVSFEKFGHEAARDYAGWAAVSALWTCLAAARHGMTKPRAVRPGFLSRFRQFFVRPVPIAVTSEPPPEQQAEQIAQCAMLREIFGNPFRPITFNPEWRTTDVMLLAQGIYAERAFDRMPILADALQDAGCDSTDILDHLRDPHATHVRGCWALDLVLGKE